MKGADEGQKHNERATFHVETISEKDSQRSDRDKCYVIVGFSSLTDRSV